MSFERGTPANTNSIVASRDFAFVLDPECLPNLFTPKYAGVVPFIEDLRRIDPPVTIMFTLPGYLNDEHLRGYAHGIRRVLREIETPEGVPKVALSKRVPRKHRDRLTGATEAGQKALSLLALANFIQADGIVTDEPRLVEARYPLLQHNGFRVIPFDECGDWMEVCAHGHGVFWSATDYNRHLTVDVFYQWTHQKNREYAKWFSTASSQMSELGVLEDVRNAVLNRYPFLLYSRDMVRFYELQMDHFTRRGLQRRFSIPLGYFMSNFYLHLWGMLDHLTLMTKLVLSLKIEDRACGIDSKGFWKVMGAKKPDLKSYVRGPNMQRWIDVMADMRHAAAHKGIHLPTELVQESEASKKSDQEISEILKEEEPDYYEGLSESAREVLEPQRIWLWRMNQLERLATNMVVVKKGERSYIWFPVASVDHDIGKLTGIMDAFFAALFGGDDRPSG